MNRRRCLLVLIICMCLLSRKRTLAQDNTPFADQNVDDLENVTDSFQELFFEALKQRAIENYDRANDALDQCIVLDKNQAVLYFEKGKNYLSLEELESAERNLTKALEMQPNTEAILEALYEVNYRSQAYAKAIQTLRLLIPIESQYKEDLARVYIQTRNFDQALSLLDELDSEKGIDSYREALKSQIYELSGTTKQLTENVEEAIQKDPKNIQEYLSLIFLYSDQGETEKAYATALAAQKLAPERDEVYLALYKFHLDQGKTKEAIDAMQRVLQSKRIDSRSKHRVLNDFLLFVQKNPQYEPALEKAIATFDTTVADANIYTAIADYFIEKNKPATAIRYLENALQQDPSDLLLIKTLANTYIGLSNFETAASFLEESLALFPSQVELYLLHGKALNGVRQFDAAIDTLEMGVDFVIDVPMEKEFYQQLSIAYTEKGDLPKATIYLKKAKSLQIPNK